MAGQPSFFGKETKIFEKGGDGQPLADTPTHLGSLVCGRPLSEAHLLHEGPAQDEA